MTRRRHGGENGMATILITHDLALAPSVRPHRGDACRPRVEQAPTATLLAAPLHPYTARLIGATPRPPPILPARGNPCSGGLRPARRCHPRLPLRQRLRAPQRRLQHARCCCARKRNTPRTCWNPAAGAA